MWPHAKKFNDIREFSDDDVRSLGRIDIISGGFPCQDISTAGKGEGLEGKQSSLWWEMLRIIDAARPDWVLAENVPALRVRGADRVLDDLEGLGYACWPQVVGASCVGAPHKRDRVWIVGHTEEINGRLLLREGEEENPEFAGTGEAMAHAPPRRFGTDGRAFGQTGHAHFRWPSRPGEHQHDWEAPRIAEFGLGDATDGLAGRLRGRANKALLRMAGNAWCYPVSLLFFRWIAEQIKKAG